MISVAALEQAARQATAGARTVAHTHDDEGETSWYVGFGEKTRGGWWENDSSLMTRADAEFVAACSPAAVLALVEATRAAERVACLPLPMSSDERMEWLTALEQLRRALGRFSFTDGTE